MATTTLLCGAFSHSTLMDMRNTADKRRGLKALGIVLKARLKAADIKATVDDNTDCDLPHLLVMAEPTGQWSRSLQLDSDLSMNADDVVHFFSGAA